MLFSINNVLASDIKADSLIGCVALQSSGLTFGTFLIEFKINI